MTSTTPVTVNHPMFARMWKVLTRHEGRWLHDRRRENLAGLAGRVLEVGAGTGTNFAFYPATVTEVVAVEPEPRLHEVASRAAETAPVPVSVLASTIEALAVDEPFDAVVCSLVLCSVGEPEAVLGRLYALLRPGGELRYFEHVASGGMQGALQRLADATVWPRLAGNCHAHRDTERSILSAGFEPQAARRSRQFPAWVPVWVAEFALGRVRRPG